MKAATIVTTVGSLQTSNIRYANQSSGVSLTGPFEITSLVGTIDFQKPNSDPTQGYGHIHIAISDSKGFTIGGHALSTGNIVYTTAEVSLLELSQGLFERLPDDGPNGSGYNELKVYQTN